MKKWLLFSFLCLILTGTVHGETLRAVYTFPEVEIVPAGGNLRQSGSDAGFARVILPGYPSAGHPGEPLLPVCPVRLVLPPSSRMVSVEVIVGGEQQIAGKHTILPSQQSYPLSLLHLATPTLPDPGIYSLDTLFPPALHTTPQIQWCRGYQIAVMQLQPVRVQPLSGRVTRYAWLEIRIETEPSLRPDKVVGCRNLATDRMWLERVVDNPAAAAAYELEVCEERVRARDAARWIVITSPILAADPGPNNFQDLIAHRRRLGFTAALVTTEEIYSEYPGVDEEEKVRNFCIDAYTTRDTEYILLGGDYPTSMPARGLYAQAEGNVDDNIKADLYFGNLDGDFDDDGDGIYGEVGDGPEGGECDLFAELFVGRACVDSGDELHNFVRKVIAYETTDPQESWLEGALYAGEFLWSNPDTYGKAYMEEIRLGSDLFGYTTAGMPGSWSHDTLYEADGSWGSSDLISRINSNSFHHIHHLGHASSSTVMKLSPSSVGGLTNTRYFFAYSQGCHAGSFDTTDCVAEAFSVSGNAAVAVVMNDRYGYGELGETDGPSQYFHRQFTDACWGEGLVHFGAMNADSKADNAWCINYKANRWVCWETNLFGDPATAMSDIPSTAGRLTLDRPGYCNGCRVTAAVCDLDLNLNPEVIEQEIVAVTADSGDTEQLTLDETGVNTSRFSGSMEVSGGSPVSNNGIIELGEGQKFRITYIDADDGFGGFNLPRTAEAYADYTAPQITSVAIDDMWDTRTRITFKTDEPCYAAVRYGEILPPAQEANAPVPAEQCEVLVEELLPCTGYLFFAVAEDIAGNLTIDDNGGAGYAFTTMIRRVLLEADMESDPAWEISGGDWEWGRPVGAERDPNGGYTGANVYGNNLNGAYLPSSPAYTLTTPAIDCSAALHTELHYYRWLTIYPYDEDRALLEVSTDGVEWTELFRNCYSNFFQDAWHELTYDLSDIADGEPTVYLRWTLGPTSSYNETGGWNIDDVTVTCVGPCDSPWLYHDSHRVDDSAGGNGDGRLNPGESAFLPVTLGNCGLDAADISATIDCDSSHITILDASGDFPDIPHNQHGESLPPHFELAVEAEAEDGDQVEFTLTWTAAAMIGSTRFHETIAAPRLLWAAVIIDDREGDADGILDPGESATMRVHLRNGGSGNAFDVTAGIEVDLPQYISVELGTAEYGTIQPGQRAESRPPHYRVTADAGTPDHTLVTFTITMHTQGAADRADTFQLDVTTSPFGLRQGWNLDENPGWSISGGQWQFGQPSGEGGQYGGPDPSSGFTGTNVYGYNLAGDYVNNMPEYHLTAGPLDFSCFADSTLRFRRWLGVERSIYDHAYLRLSTDGESWVTIWENPDSEIADQSWTEVEYDLSSADEEEEVYLRWTMGDTDIGWTYCGWNIDDIEIWANSSEIPPSATPSPTPTLPPATSTPTQLPPTRTPSPAPTTTATCTPTIAPPTETPVAPPSPTQIPASPTPAGETPTATPTTTGIPATPTPEPGTISITLLLNQTGYTPGDRFLLQCRLTNNHETQSFDQYILLDVYQSYWFWPDWEQVPGHLLLSLRAGEDRTDTILDFIWPEGAGSAEDIRFWGALFHPGTFDFACNYSMISFYYGI